MLDGRGNFEWSQTSNLLALLINMNRKKGTPLMDPRKLNPFAPKKKTDDRIKLNTKDSMDLLRTVFCKK
jgi:hypothetical protein